MPDELQVSNEQKGCFEHCLTGVYSPFTEEYTCLSLGIIQNALYGGHLV